MKTRKFRSAKTAAKFAKAFGVKLKKIGTAKMADGTKGIKYAMTKKPKKR